MALTGSVLDRKVAGGSTMMYCSIASQLRKPGRANNSDAGIPSRADHVLFLVSSSDQIRQLPKVAVPASWSPRILYVVVIFSVAILQS